MQQRDISPVNMDECEGATLTFNNFALDLDFDLYFRADIEEEICDGEAPLVDFLGVVIDCGSSSVVCPSGSYCHSVGGESRCCREGSFTHSLMFLVVFFALSKLYFQSRRPRHVLRLLTVVVQTARRQHQGRTVQVVRAPATATHWERSQ